MAMSPMLLSRISEHLQEAQNALETLMASADPGHTNGVSVPDTVRRLQANLHEAVELTQEL
jgi:hypothetical protein